MDVDVAEALPHHAVPFDQSKHFFVGGHDRGWQSREKCEHLLTGFQLAAGDFADHKWMGKDLFPFERLDERRY